MMMSLVFYKLKEGNGEIIVAKANPVFLIRVTAQGRFKQLTA